MPSRMKASEPMTAGCTQRTNSKLVCPKSLAIDSFRSQPFRSARSKATRAQYTAVNRFNTSPRISVTAKPFNWSVPIANSTTAVMSVVRFESTIVENAR